MFVTRGDARSLNHSPQDSVVINLPFANITGNVFFRDPKALSVRDKRSGVDFEGEFCLKSGQRGCPRITGTGVRSKKVAGLKNLNVYAMAFYVDEHATKHTLHSKFGNSSAEALAKNQALFDELIKARGIEKSLILVITSRLVKNKNFLEALNERLAPPLKEANQTKTLEEFKTQFDSVKFKSGLKISFTVKGDKLVTKANGKEIGSIKNKVLSDTLLDIYLGKNCVSKDAQLSWGKGLARMILS